MILFVLELLSSQIETQWNTVCKEEQKQKKKTR